MDRMMRAYLLLSALHQHLVRVSLRLVLIFLNFQNQNQSFSE
jgi:hypothetical protein